MFLKRAYCAVVLLALISCAGPGHAQSMGGVILPGGCGTGNPTNSLSYLTLDPTLKLCVNATVSASVSGFTPAGTFAVLTASGSSGSVALPAGTTVAIQNTGTTQVSCTLGVGSATATANQIQVSASSTVFVTPGSNTFGACIDQSGTTSNTVVLAGGSGLGTGFGGGGGGSGGGTSNITQWASTTLGAPTAYGTAPTGNAPGVNASITNTPSVAVASSVPEGTTADTACPASGVATIVGCMRAAVNTPPSVSLNGTNTPGTGNTPGTTRTGAIVATDTNIAGMGGQAINPCASGPLIPVPISQATSTQILALASGKKNYVCSITIVGSDAENISLVEGTGSVCATSIAALIGGTTAANGMNFGANAGFALPGGGLPIAAGTNASFNVCLLQSGTGRVSGVAMMAQQ